MALLKVVVDTNVIVSGLAYPQSIPGHILGAWRNGRLNLVVSRYILDEIARVLPRLKRANVDEKTARDIADTFLFLAEVVEPIAVDEPELRDMADNPILGTLAASQASYLIIGDKDLLILAEKYPILTVSEFWQRFGE